MTGMLVLGANGQVGRQLVRGASEQGLAATALTRSDLDITNQQAVEDSVLRLKPDVVVNAAAYTAVDRAESEPEKALAVNAEGPGYLAEACARQGAVLVHLSTDYVFDGKKTGAYTESDEVAPLGVYGRSKEAGEQAIRRHLDRHIILRTSWVYGLDGNNFVKTMLRLATEREEVSVVADQVGCPTWAGDLAGAVFAAAGKRHHRAEDREFFGTFHCAGDGQTSWHGFAEAIFRHARARGFQVPRVLNKISSAEYPAAAPRPANSVLDCSRFAHTYGYRMPRWEESLARMLDGCLKP
ncbi:dTDP-4-dehydrorhamnose reductase [Roseibium hamelinense]|uniref:dTDP-4-dehydrorhamnose reductase n=1 Tax=Roseibium hamelinense TaxID=150831 RepID=A0A562THE5_9HYPH|nr:dTDP-4-dehydrorhamnose reductase [Roseibium hamelinense]MTI45766.1 dTDP-4-dehydrorhamnose reductase [Roseibium hamelinense]TWI93051.1 dTDP-4-dehydrorhamnose reductase [Roseibium hamelinense]